MKKVLLTGATGFIGRHCLLPLVASGYEVHAVCSTSPWINVPGVSWHQADLLEPHRTVELMALVRPAQLLHFAWITEPVKYWTSPENTRWVQASLELLTAFARHGGQRVVMAGSCAEYDWRHGYCSERTTPLAPSTLYGVCKHSLQCMLDSFAREFGLSSAWGRIFFLYGPQENPQRLVASVIRSLLQGNAARCSHGNQIRDFLYTKDAAAAFVALLESKVTGPVNIASGTPLTVKQLVYEIGHQLGRQELIELNALPACVDEPPLLVADVRRLTD